MQNNLKSISIDLGHKYSNINDEDYIQKRK